MVNFRPFKTLVLGDFLLDSYTFGRVRRISPEAPVPILDTLKQEYRPGGAGNVVLSLQALGGQTVLSGRIGRDDEGELLKKILKMSGAEVENLHIQEDYPTPIKNRLIADGQQLLRLDREKMAPLSLPVEEIAIQNLRIQIPQVEVVALSDYGKGFLTPRIIQSALQIAKTHNIPTIIDPKGADFTKYRGARLIKPNLSEAYAAARLPFTASLEDVAQELFSITQVEMLLITRSEEGSSLFTQSGARTDFPVRCKEVKDVTGAGDTVLALMCLGIAHQAPMELTVHLANVAAGIAIGRLGCAQVTLAEVMGAHLEYEPKG